MLRAETLLQANHYTETARPLPDQIADLSAALQPLMRRYGIAAHFAQPQDGLVLLDATRNETAAYKVRGALASTYAATLQGSDAVWTASAGNHGVGVALAAQLLGLEATVYVPVKAPDVKVAKIEAFGAHVVRTGSDFDECLSLAHNLQALDRRRSSFLHPFDTPVVAAGQGTLGIELFEHFCSLLGEQTYETVRLFVPIGGGGLISGMASTLRNLWSNSLPPLQIIGVVDESSPASLVGTLFGRPVKAFPDTIADGTRVARVGHTFLSVAPLIDFIMPVPHDAIVATMRSYHSQTGEALEPSGALALTGEFLTRRHSLLPGTKSALHYAVLSGRNVDLETFTALTSEPSRRCERSLCRTAYQVRIPERDGELLRFLNAVGEFNIASITYKQRPRESHGELQAEFEVKTSQVMELHERLTQAFPNSICLHNNRRLLLPVGDPVAHEYRDELITLDDRPGSFRDYVQQLHDAQNLGSVGFLFYRQPSQPGAKAQVVIGRAPPPPH